MIKIDTIYIHLTKQCNLQCDYCYFDAGKEDVNELTTHELISIINDIPILNPRRIIFTGGEPLLRNDLLDLATEVTRINKKIVLGLTTNGILININNSQQLVRLFDEIRISIDGPRDINDFQRGPNSFENAMHALKCIINAGGNPSAFITATSINIVHLKVFMKYLINQGICKIHISPVKIVGRAKDETLLCDFKVLKNIVQEFYFEQFGLQIKSRGEESCNCGVGNYISINPDGSVYPCHVLSYPELCIGNLRNESLHSIILNSDLMNTPQKFNFKEISQRSNCPLGLSVKNSCLGQYFDDKSL